MKTGVMIAAQELEHWPTNLEVVGSNLIGCCTFFFFPIFFLLSDILMANVLYKIPHSDASLLRMLRFQSGFWIQSGSEASVELKPTCHIA